MTDDNTFSLVSAMETTHRCILRFVPSLGWSATNAEGADDAQLIWQTNPCDALCWMLGRGINEIQLTFYEQQVIDRVQHAETPWRCEFNCKDPQNRWCDPFQEPKIVTL